MFNLKAIQDSSDKQHVIATFIYKHKFLCFLIVFGLQMALNLYKIDDISIWYDESFTINTANKSIAGIVQVSASDVNPPLYPIIVHYWMKLFGISEFSVRLLSALAAAFASSFLFLFCLRFLNWQAAIFSAAMFFTSYVFFYYAQEARTYSFILLFVVWSNHLFFRLAEEKQARKSIWFSFLLAVVNIGLFYLHFLSCFAIIAQAILFLFFVFEKKTGENEKGIRFNVHFLKYYFLSWLVFFLLLLPFYKRFLFLVQEGGKKMWLQKPVYQDLKNTVYEMFNAKEVYQVYIYSLIIICVLLLFRWFRNDGFKLKIVLFGLISGPGMLFLNFQVASYSPIFLLRYVLFTLLGFIVMYSYLLSELRLNFNIKFLLFLPILIFAFIKIKMPKEVVEDYKNAVAYLKSVKNEHTLVSTDLPDVFAYYYDKKTFNITDDAEKARVLFSQGIFVQNYDLDWPNRLDFTKVKDIYYTQTFEYLNDPARTVAVALGNKFEMVESIETYKGVHIAHFRNRNFKE
jgi:mannosyltransferase